MKNVLLSYTIRVQEKKRLINDPLSNVGLNTSYSILLSKILSIILRYQHIIHARFPRKFSDDDCISTPNHLQAIPVQAYLCIS